MVGADVPASTETDHTIGQRLISSNTQLTAIRYYSDTEQRSNITIANAQTKQIKTVTFENIGLDGLYLVAWSPDNKYLYVSGGMWEFTAPAALWKVDVATGAKTKYSNLTGFRFPIMAYPAHDVAYVLKDFDGDDMFNPTTRPISLYQFSLSNPAAPTVVATEQAQVAFSSLFRIQNNLFYQNQIAEENNEIKKYNLDTQSAGTLAKGDVWLLAHSENEPWMVIYNNDRYEIISTTGGKTYDIGKGAMSFGMRVPEDATEYILNIIGIVPKQ